MNKKEAMNLKMNKEEDRGGFGGRERGHNVTIVLSKK